MFKALLSRIEQGTVTAGDVADRFETDENGNEWAVINGQRVSPDAVITGAVTLNNALFIDCDFNGAKVERKWFNYLKTQKVKNFDKIRWQ